MARIAIHSPAPGFYEEAVQLGKELGLPQLGDADPASCDALLETGPDGFQLRPCGPKASGPVRVDFGSGAMRHRRSGGQMELLGRAVGAGKRETLHVVDATAGLGRDSFVLADSGCQVTLLERSPLVHALLRDGLQRARDGGDDWLRSVVARMELVGADACDWLRQLAAPVDVIYLDPMFPERRKSARVKKEMWLFQTLLETEGDGVSTDGKLLSLALESAVYRVVVKRPLKAAPLDMRKPGFSLKGKAVRFDVYSLRKL